MACPAAGLLPAAVERAETFWREAGYRRLKATARRPVSGYRWQTSPARGQAGIGGVSGQSWAHLSVYGQWQDAQATRLYISRATGPEKNSIGVEIARTDGREQDS
ncbi:hypothetical protein D3C85_1525120 [compost metagenome]